MSHGVGHRHGSNVALLWLWCRQAAAAQILPLTWELPYTAGAALKGKKKKKKERNEAGPRHGPRWERGSWLHALAPGQLWKLDVTAGARKGLGHLAEPRADLGGHPPSPWPLPEFRPLRLLE